MSLLPAVDGAAFPDSVFLDPPHHYAYIVRDLDEAIEEMVLRLGAGPFLRPPRASSQRASSAFGAAAFEHSSAFGQCGSFAIELMQIHNVAPARAKRAFDPPYGRLHHVAWVVPSLDRGIESLESRGFDHYLRAGFGEIDFAFHDARGTLGHDIELHQECGPLRGFWSAIREASIDWDGRNPSRTLGPPA